jgi:hypothetical protein
MKVKELREQVRESLLQSTQTYCCYCLEPHNGGIECCGENHFVTFADLCENDQDFMILEEMSEMLP